MSRDDRFQMGSLEFQRRTYDGGRYEWLTADGRFRAARVVHTYEASDNGTSLGKAFATLRLAMAACLQSSIRRPERRAA